jgi:ABC-type uncharacterized transport system substrate-binding protein
VTAGLVASLNRPGGNLTGLSVFNTALVAKRLELLHELAPNATAIAVLLNPNTQAAQSAEAEAKAAAHTLGLPLTVLTASTKDGIDAAFAAVVQRGAGPLVVAGDAFFNSRHEQLVALATHHKIPTIYDRREIVVAGGLMSYGSNSLDMYRQLAIYTGRILKGAKPADLPVVQPSKFELVVNLKTAKAIGVELPTAILLRADEVIE